MVDANLTILLSASFLNQDVIHIGNFSAFVSTQDKEIKFTAMLIF